MAPPWRIRYYKAEDGTIPFKGFINRLKTRQERANCFTWIEMLNILGDKLNGNQYLTHPNGMREIRDKSMRIFYVCDDDYIVIIDGLLPMQGNEHFDAICRKAKDYAGYD
ncbi:MAG: hypothetical protein LC803_23625 [Acidobacteria bacterium]|nr:hypothetical protein [Acidobacteriota bacterium]